MAVTLLDNSNSLIFIDSSQWQDQLLKIAAPPDVVLLNSWEQEKTEFHKIQPLITKLIDLGCKYFVCAGKYSEPLHDFIDDVILEISLSSQQGNGSNIVTTWHNVDTDDEVADFFIHSTSSSNNLLVAFLDERRPEDAQLKKAILTLVGRDL